jgi:outer membrane biosynthesis protein TonB
MKTSARMRSVSQSVQPEDPPSAKKQKTAAAKPKERTKRQPSVVQEEVDSDMDEPVVEKPKKKVAAKPAVEKKAKENKPIAPRLTVRKVGNSYFHQTRLTFRPHLSMTNPRTAMSTMYPLQRRKLEPPHEVSALNHPRSANRSARPMTISWMTTGRSRNHSRS